MDAAPKKVSQKSFVMKTITIEETLEAGNFNSNNHDPDEFEHLNVKPITSEEYEARLNPFSSFLHLLPNSNDIKQIHLKKLHVNLLIQIGKIASIRGKLPKSFQDEFELILNQLAPEYASFFDGLYFVKFDRCSLKDGIHGPGPYNSLEMVLTSLITSARCVRSMTKGNDVLYLVPWNSRMTRDREFRVFVYESEITAISQYVWDTDMNLEMLDLIDFGNRIREFQQTNISPHWKSTDYSFDVYVGDKEIELIELNSFGVQLAAASCLFHWIHDFDQLYGRTDHVEFRVVTS